MSLSTSSEQLSEYCSIIGDDEDPDDTQFSRPGCGMVCDDMLGDVMVSLKGMSAHLRQAKIIYTSILQFHDGDW